MSRQAAGPITITQMMGTIKAKGGIPVLFVAVPVGCVLAVGSSVFIGDVVGSAGSLAAVARGLARGSVGPCAGCWLASHEYSKASIV